MWRGQYGREPFDLRLTALRMLYQFPLIGAAALAGTLVLGSLYYVKNVLWRGERQFLATSVYHVDYDVEEEKDVGVVYINETTWNTYLQSRLFLEAVQRHLADSAADVVWDSAADGSALAGTWRAVLPSDLRALSTVVTTDSPQKSALIAEAVEAAVVQELAEAFREVRSIQIVDPGDTAEEAIPDVRVGRAFALSAALSFFFAFVVLLLRELGDDSIWLPSSLWKRYGLKTAGTVESRELAENMKYFFRQGGRVAVCAVQEQGDPAEVLARLRQACPDTVGEGWFAELSPAGCPEVCETLRGADGILLAVWAGRHAGRQLEHVLEYLEQQDCPVTAAVLWDADEKLIRLYQGCGLGLPGKGKR